MGYLDNEYGWVGDENYPPAYIDLLLNLDVAYKYGDDETLSMAQKVLVEHISWLETLLEWAIQEGQELFDEDEEDNPFNKIELAFGYRR